MGIVKEALSEEVMSKQTCTSVRALQVESLWKTVVQADGHKSRAGNGLACSRGRKEADRAAIE